MTFYLNYAIIHILESLLFNDSFPGPKGRYMHTDWFSYFFGAIVVFVIPMMTVVVWADTYKGATRYQRLDAWQFATLIGTTMLAGYTYFFVHQGTALFIDELTQWGFCGAGIVLSLLLQLGKKHVANKQRQLEDRLVQAVLSR